MKRCPECRRDYHDDSLIYCLEDGAALVSGVPDEPATAILNSEAPTRVHSAETSSPSDPVATTAENFASSRRLVMAGVLGVLLVAAIGIGAYWFYDKRTGKQINSIAVMPFVNESGNPEFEYVSDGVTEELISSLTRLPGLTVKPRSTIIRYKGQNTDAKTLGSALGVGAILNGSVAQRGDEVALHVELVDATTDSVLWSDDYRKPLAALATLHSEIARDISNQLRAKLSSSDQQRLVRKYTDNAEAYQLYRKGRFHWNKSTREDVQRSTEYYRQAIDLDPNYALAYSGLADAYMNLPGYDRTVTPRETLPKAREYTLKALSLDDSLSEAHVAMGRVLMYHDHDFAGAERELKRAIELDTNNAFAFHSYGGLLTGLGRRDEAEANFKRAIQLEPESPGIVRAYSFLLMVARRYDEAEAQLKKAIDLEPNRAVTYYSLCTLYLLRAKYADSVEACARAREMNGKPEAASAMRETFLKGGVQEFVRGLAEDRWPVAGNIAYIYATYFVILGEKERALERLEKAYEDREGFIPMINVDPRFDGLRDEPRFQGLVKKVGLSK
jgi:TolB-like protein/Tfp pilus assembly protein PilF